jgi:hypothetical protein
VIEVIPSLIHHCQNPLEFICKIKVCPEYHFKFVRHCYLLTFKMYCAGETTSVAMIRLLRMLISRDHLPTHHAVEKCGWF